MQNLENDQNNTSNYSAKDIHVLEGLEPVRHRPGMYIGGTDERALHHLVAEILDNAMDEVVAGHASKIEMTLNADNSITISDNGRGIPIDKHPKFPEKSALEVILTTLHSGGKFYNEAYKTAGGLHGVGISVVNALSIHMSIDVYKDKKIYQQTYSKGTPTSAFSEIGTTNKKGTSITFKHDPEIFGESSSFKPTLLYKLAKSKAYLHKGVQILWKYDTEDKENSPVPIEEKIHFPNGITDYLNTLLSNSTLWGGDLFEGSADLPNDEGRIEWAVAWAEEEKHIISSYCNTIPTPLGGNHENGIKLALTKGIKTFGDLIGNKKTSNITTEDVVNAASIIISIFIKNPQFQGQTKEKLSTSGVGKLVDHAIKDHFEHWLAKDSSEKTKLFEHILERAEERIQKKNAKNAAARKTATRRLRLPGKLADCSQKTRDNSELFIVEGDSAGGSAKQARQREFQAILPLRGKILNVASATKDKLNANQELQDLTLALGCGRSKEFDLDKLRYEKIIIMTDADVDGAHIASLLITFFYREMPKLIEKGHLFLAKPPLYKLKQGSKIAYAYDDEDKDKKCATIFDPNKKLEISRFKGLGEMQPKQLKETTMDQSKRMLYKVKIPEISQTLNEEDPYQTADLVEKLMGKKAEHRFNFIQENARFATDIDI